MKAGWSGEPKGSMNQGEKAVGAMRRIPIEGLTQGLKPGRAIVVMRGGPIDFTQPFDVLVIGGIKTTAPLHLRILADPRAASLCA